MTTAFDTVAAMRRGVNMGNALEAPNEGEWGVTIKENYFDHIKEAGFKTVRIPIRWNAHAAESAPYTIDPAFFAHVDEVVKWALNRDLIVIVNIHHYEEMMSAPQHNRERFLALWQQIAEHYKSYPSTLVFELLNEPNSQLDAAQWNEISSEALGVVRESNPLRDVVIGPVNWNGYEWLSSLDLPADDQHIIATYHYYLPFQFTHQGADWVDGSAPWLGTTWDATEMQKQEIIGHFDAVAAWAKAHNRPILLGEFGAYSRADMPSRARWTDFVARAAEERGFAWTYWEFCSGFGAYDPFAEQWNEPLLKALVP